MADDPPDIDYPALARRYLDLWQEQVAKLGQDPTALNGMFAAWAKMMVPVAPFSDPASSDHAGTADPPRLHPAAGTAAGTAAAAGPYGGGSLDHAALLDRIDALERRIAELEGERAISGAPAPRPRRKPKPDSTPN